MKKVIRYFKLPCLIFTIYYLAIRITGGMVTTIDIVVCGTVIAVCVVNLIMDIAHWQKKKSSSETEYK